MSTIDETKLEELMGRLGGFMTGGALCAAIWLGDELGLYRVLAGSGTLTADEVAGKSGCNPRLVREWLDGQVAGGLVDYDAGTDAYTLSAESAFALADDTSPAFVARGMNALASFFLDQTGLLAAFRGDGGMAWGDHHPCLFAGTEWFFRTGYRALLATEWIPALDGVQERLVAGARIADVGCGHGASAVVLAQAYPNSQVFGFDYHEPSVATARERAEEAGVTANTTFAVADAKGYDGQYDVICFFDCLHDMGDPVGIARYAREHLAPGGTLLVVEPFALDDRVTNIAENPMAALMYTASSVVCTPNSLSQEVGLGLGAQAGAARLEKVFNEAGFTHFRKAAETPMNLILEVRV